MSKRCPYKSYTYAREFKLEALGCCKTQVVQRLGFAWNQIYDATSDEDSLCLSSPPRGGVWFCSSPAGLTGFMDRLTHHCHMLEISNNSYRFKHSSSKQKENPGTGKRN